MRAAACDYGPAFLIAGALCLVAGAAFLTVGRTALAPAAGTVPGSAPVPA